MNEVKLSDAIAEALARRGIRHIFGIIGSANAHLFDSIYRHPQLNLICLHHEQACVMAAHGYYMQSGRMAAVLVTAGAGITNALTGVVGSWADSIPLILITGQEATKQFKGNNLARMIGIQGVYTDQIYQTCTKSVVTCQTPLQAYEEILKAIRLARQDRCGPCIVDLPIDLQSAKIPDNDLKVMNSRYGTETINSDKSLSVADFNFLLEAFSKAKRPLLWLGNGLRRLPRGTIETIINQLGIPYLTSWTANDLIDPIDRLNAGHAGTYGGRVGNLILQSCDLLICLGTRLAIPQKGYVDDELAREAEIFVVDCDPIELAKLGPRFSNKYLADAPSVLQQLHQAVLASASLHALSYRPWLEHLAALQEAFPIVEACHRSPGWINSYEFMYHLGSAAPANVTFVTDMGTALISGFQVLVPRAGQRLFTSQGLGEMGYGLPGAIGAYYADPSRMVVCLNCDGGLMMNLQDLHSVIGQNIPMKIIIFNNDGYLMIKHTQNAIVAGRRAGTDRASGLTCPDYEPLVKAFGFFYLRLTVEDRVDTILEQFFSNSEPCVLEVFMSPEQLLVPKLSVSITAEGKLISPPLEDLSPLIPLDKLRHCLGVPLHPNSLGLQRGTEDAQGDAIY